MKLTYLFLLMALVASPLHASPQEELEQTRKDMEQTRAHQEQLAAQTRKINAELEELQGKLVERAATVQKGEGDLSASEERLRILNEQMSEKTSVLAKRRGSLASLVQAALRLSRTPPEAVIMMPGDTEQTMKAARALKMAEAAIRQETESLGIQLRELEDLRTKVEAGREQLSHQQVALDKERQALSLQLAARKVLQQKITQQQQEETDKLAKLAQQAEDLEDLVKSLKKNEKEERHERAARQLELEPDERAPTGKRGKLRSFDDAKGHIRPPAAGTVVQNYGASSRNDTSKGILITTRARAQVTAPYDGEVVFSGPFLAYGKLVIIRHSDDFHTLIAGLSKIDVAVGQFLLEGEPIGAMGDSKSDNKLYFELRKNNQPVDPSPWISGMRKKQETD